MNHLAVLARRILPLMLVVLACSSAWAGPAQGATATVRSGTLTIIGTDRGERIALRRSPARTALQVNVGDDRSVEFTFALRSFTRVVLDARGGNDTIRVDEARGAIPKAMTFVGSLGNDRITGGRGAERIVGAAGGDVVQGNGGNDVVELGAGNDTYLWTVGGDLDTVSGGTGSNLVRVLGTSASETITASNAGSRLTIASGTGSVSMLAGKRLQVFAGAGDDTVAATSLGGLGLTQVLLGGGAGLDTARLGGTDGADAISSATSGSVTGTSAGIAVGVDLFEGLAIEAGAGNDTYVGGDANETFFGGDGDDSITRSGGFDQVDAGAGADAVAIVGSAGADVWSFGSTGALFTFASGTSTLTTASVEAVSAAPGDGADTVAFGSLAGSGVTTVALDLQVAGADDADADAISATGTSAADTLTATAAAPLVTLTGLGATISMSGAVAANDDLALAGGDGDDVVSGTVGLAALVGFSADGGAGADTVNGGNGADVLTGGAGADVVDGNGGLDTATLGDGSDQFVWDPGDGSDVVEGGEGTDTLRFNGSAGAEIFAVSQNGSRVTFTRNVGNIVMDLVGVEGIELDALGGTDTITVGNTEETPLRTLVLDLGVNGLGDALPDAITFNGRAFEDAFTFSPVSADSVFVFWYGLTTLVDGAETANDTFTINAGGGADVISADPLASPPFSSMSFNGGAGNDWIVGSNGPDFINGEDGDDRMFGEAGNDTFTGGTGTDTADGGLGTDSADGTVEVQSAM